MSGNKSSSKLFIVIGLVLVIGGAGFYFYQQNKLAPATATSTEFTEDAGLPTTASSDQDGLEITDTALNNVTTSSEAVNIDVEKALAPRTLGSVDAPVTIREYASLTCGHCGEFHKNTFDQIKTEYIDTGKVHFIFNDFPLNGPALHAGMIARCMDESRYFNFLGMLFKNQEDWAYDKNYITYLRQNAALAGLGNNAFDACINNEDLKQGLTDNMRADQQKYTINSTPTFVINEDNVVTGARDFEAFKTIIEEELAKSQ